MATIAVLTDNFPGDGAKENSKERVDFEEAITLTGHGKFHHILLFGCGCCLLSMMMVTLITGYLLPSAQCDLNLSTQDKGILNAICFIGMISSSHLWGFLADTKGRRKTLILSLTLDSLCGILASFSPTFTILVVFRYFNGFFICGPAAVMYAYLGEFHSEATRTRTILISGIFIGMGITCLPGLAWLILPQTWSFELPWCTYNSWRIFIAFCSLPSLVTALIFYLLLPESPKFLLSLGREEEALDVLRSVFARNSGHQPQEYPVKALKGLGKVKEIDILSPSVDDSNRSRSSVAAILLNMWQQTLPLFKKPYLRTSTLACILNFGIFASSNGLILWLPEILNRFTEYGNRHPEHPLTICEIMDDVPINRSVTMNNLEPNGNDDREMYLTVIDTECQTAIDSAVFITTVIIGAVSAVAYLFVGVLTKFISPKLAILFCLTVSGASGIGLNYVNSGDNVLALSCIFMALSGCCVSVVTSQVVAIIPTHLRAMAVCIALMMGRVGAVTGSVVVGFLLELSCQSMFFVLGGTILGCAFLSLFIPNVQSREGVGQNDINLVDDKIVESGTKM